MYKKGFTLSEVMVALMVVGVIAAVIIPIIASTKPDENRLMFKKAYYITERVVNDLINDDVLYPDDDSKPGFVNTIEVTLNGTTYGGTGHEADKFCKLFGQRVNTTGAVNCVSAKSVPASGSTGLNSGNFTTADGITWHIPISTYTAGETKVIVVDVNGTGALTKDNKNCKYNAATCPEPDQFEILIQNDGKISVVGVKESEYLKTIN